MLKHHVECVTQQYLRALGTIVEACELNEDPASFAHLDSLISATVIPPGCQLSVHFGNLYLAASQHHSHPLVADAHAGKVLLSLRGAFAAAAYMSHAWVQSGILRLTGFSGTSCSLWTGNSFARALQLSLEKELIAKHGLPGPGHWQHVLVCQSHN